MAITNFNSIKVRLRQLDLLQHRRGRHHFNSIKVRLRHYKRNIMAKEKEYFNSIKVRLRQDTSTKDSTGDLFQFHKGSIKTQVDEGGIKIVTYFNSIKVRLRLMFVCPSILATFISIP